MSKTLLEELKDARIANEPAYVSFYNNGKIGIDKHSVNDRMTPFCLEDMIRTIRYS